MNKKAFCTETQGHVEVVAGGGPSLGEFGGGRMLFHLPGGGGNGFLKEGGGLIWDMGY